MRILIIILLFFAIIALCGYAAFIGPRLELAPWQTLEEAEKYDGLLIESGYNRVTGILDQFVIIAPYKHQISLKVDPDFKIKPNDFISYRGKVDKEGYIIVSEIYVHKSRTLKYLSSLVAGLVIAVWFFKKYKFNLKRFYFEKKTGI